MFGRILKVDLTSGKTAWESVPQAYLDEYIGGSGLGARLLWDALDTGGDPLDPASPLLWVTGPLTGTRGPATSRSSICGRSPQTGLWGESNIGGFVGAELRTAGVDVLWITGRASQPVFLWIHDGEVEIRPAGMLWGTADTYQAQERIRADLGLPRARVACIGLAGENGVPMAGILSDHGRAAGRTGMGALMGSKNLKAIAVRGTGVIPLAQPEAYRELRTAANRALREQNMTAVMHETGTAGAAEYLQMLGDMPVKYWTGWEFEGVEKISGGEMAQTILTGKTGCHACVIACGREVTIPDGPYVTGGPAKGPEYETICAFGSLMLSDDLAQITALGDLCDRLGLDTISAGSTLALAYLLYDRGLLGEQDTGGLALHWGDASPCFTLLPQMARRERFGALLAEGARALGAHFGAPELAVQVNNLELPMHDPRAFSGQALSYLLSPRGACHNSSDYFSIELGGSQEDVGLPMTPRDVDGGKAHYVARHNHWRSACNNLAVCFFAVTPVDTLLCLLAAATGQDWSLEEMLRAGERSWNLKRLINLRLGWTREREKLPHLLRQPLEGGQMGHVPDEELMLREYYAASGWDLQAGSPLPEKLEQLNLGFTEAPGA